MPHHLDAASFLNTKTMCLITNYYKKLTLKSNVFGCFISCCLRKLGSDHKLGS